MTCRRLAACLALAAGAALAPGTALIAGAAPAVGAALVDCLPVPATSTPATSSPAAVGPAVARRKPAVHRKPVVRRSIAAPQRQAVPKKPHRKAASPARVAAALPSTLCAKPAAAPATAVGAYSETIAVAPLEPVPPASAVDTPAGSATGELVPPVRPAVGAAPTDPPAVPSPLQPGWPTSVPGLLPTGPYLLLPLAPVPGVPEPSTGWMALAGLAVIAACGARRSRSARRKAG